VEKREEGKTESRDVVDVKSDAAGERLTLDQTRGLEENNEKVKSKKRLHGMREGK